MSALIIIDIQNDFITGSLKVNGTSTIIQNINNLKKNKQFDLIVFSQDSHPHNHSSFASTNNQKEFTEIELLYKNIKYKQIMWPDHCIKNTFGEKFHHQIELSNNDIVIKKEKIH